MASEMAQSGKGLLALQAWGLSLLPRTNVKEKKERGGAALWYQLCEAYRGLCKQAEPWGPLAI